MEIQVFRNENSSQTNAYSHYSNYSYSGLIPNERALRDKLDISEISDIFTSDQDMENTPSESRM